MKSLLAVTTRYQMREMRDAFIIFFGVILALYLITLTLNVVFFVNDEVYVNFTGNEMSCLIFIFVMGLCTVRESFNFALQNNISRRSLLQGKAVAAAVSCLLLALFSRTLTLLSTTALFRDSEGEVGEVYSLMFAERGAGMVQNYFESVFYVFAAAMVLLALGYLIALAYYRMNRMAKSLVSIGVPALLILSVLLDISLTGGRACAFIGSGILYLLGITNANPYIGIASMLVLAALIWLIVIVFWQRLQVKP